MTIFLFPWPLWLNFIQKGLKEHGYALNLKQVPRSTVEVIYDIYVAHFAVYSLCQALWKIFILLFFSLWSPISLMSLLCCRVLLGKSCAMTLNQVSWSKFKVKDMYNVLKKCFLLLHFVKKNQESILCHDIYSVHIKMQICYMQPFFTCRIFCYLLNRPKYHI